MGSNQSSPSDSVGSFSIDPSGNITHKSSPSSTSQSSADDSSPRTSRREADNRDGQESDHLSQSLPAPPSPPSSVPSSGTDSPFKASSETDSGLSLREADEIVSRMKQKYKPSSQEMAGKNKSVFEHVERNLQTCYTKNKDQPLNCLAVTEEYQNYVRQQRSQLLKRSMNLPLVTSILVILTCVLLHITTVSCYGAMSIDLGSEWMKVGLVAPNVQMDIVLNAQSQRKTPMAIAFSNGERYIGDSALDVASKYPERTFTHFLDLAGKQMNDESVKHFKKRFPHIEISSHEPNSTSILLKHPQGLEFTPLELIAMMIEHAHDQVVNRLNSNEPASDVVITVPPFFNQVERRVIRDAVKLAGLKLLRLTNVNSAFALSYGIFRHKDYGPESSSNRTSILFIDQGASHTSATLADYHLVEQVDEATRMSKNESLPTVSVRAQVYDRYLGGFDMQLKLRDHLVDIFAKKNNIDKSRIYKRGKSASKVLKEAGRVKKVLSANTDHLVRIENVIDDKDMRHPITRAEFEELNQDALDDRMRKLLDKLFEMPEVNLADPLESVIIVGGNTRTPRVQQVLMDYFKLDTLGKSINADEGAALAALYQAASLGRGFRVKKFVLEEFGEERIRYDPAKVIPPTTTTTTTTTTTPAPASSDDATPESTTTAAPAETTTPKVVEVTTPRDPNAIYSESELERISRKLAHLKEQDYLRMQRLSLMNSLESLLTEGREKLSEEMAEVKDNREALQKLISETSAWIEDGDQVEKDNVTLLAEKYTYIYALVHPPPPAPPVLASDAETFDSSDLANVINNKTMSILDALSNFTSAFGQANDSTEDLTATEATTTTPDPKGEQQATTTPAPPPAPSKVKPEPKHSEL